MMFGPGEYRPDPSAGIIAPADLPQPEIVPYSRNAIRQSCPHCGHSAYRDKQYQRTLHDLGNLDLWCPRDLLVTYSQHYCTKCRTYFSADLSDLAPPGGQYTHRVMDLAFLDWALADFWGYVAADELYDGPFCILSAVDNRRYKRLLYDVLDHDPTHDDIRVFLRRLKTALVARGLTLCGVTTDGSALYPEPLKEVFGKVRHQICQFHIVAEVVKAVTGAVASARKGLAAQQPKLRRGRPRTPAAKQAARTKKRLEAQRTALFTHRYLFVQRHLNKTERKTLWRVSRGLPQLHALRAVMDQVYALFDRRCRTQTALDKLAKLRRRLQRFPQLGEILKKLFSPTLDKALTFLDDKLLPSTSNAVERGNRRYRKMQKSVYRVRTHAQIRARLALDMWREAHAEGRQQTLESLHRARAG